MMNVYAGDEKDRFSFKAGYYASVFRPSVILGNSLAVGLGYDRKIGKIRLITNVEYRWGRLKTIGLHAGIGF